MQKPTALYLVTIRIESKMKKYYKRIQTILFLCLAISSAAWAQNESGGGNGINTAYSRYGFGQLNDAVVGRQNAMGGVALGMRDGAQVNVSNPASYSACDSLTFLFDAGVSGQNGNFDNGSTKMNVKNASFDYLAMQFRAFKHIGVSFGFMPYSKVNYQFATTHENITDKYGDTTPYSTFSGYGGLSQGYLGVGAKLIAGLSVGANFNYLFGDIEHKVENSFTTSSVYTSARSYKSSIKTFKMDLGVQYEQDLTKHDKVVLGATYTLGHDINAEALRTDYTYNKSSESGTSIEGTSEARVENAFQLPNAIGVGITYARDAKLLVGFDYTIQKWGDVKYPMTTKDGYVSQTGFLTDRNKIALGIEYTPNNMSRRYLNRVHYRIGGYTSTPYTKINGKDGAKEFGLSAGFGFPIQNQWNNRSVVHITGQWVHVSPGAGQLITENYLRVCVGITFNERMFAKWKVN